MAKASKRHYEQNFTLAWCRSSLHLYAITNLGAVRFHFFAGMKDAARGRR